MTPKKIFLFSIGPLGGAFFSLITLPVTAWYFQQEDVGRISMLQVTIGFSTLLFSLGLDQAYVREFHEVNDKPSLLKNAVLPGLITLVSVLILLLSLGGKVSGWLFDRPEWGLSLLIVVSLLSAFISRFLSLVLRMNERGLAFSMSQLLPKLLLLCIICGYVVFDSNRSLLNLVIAHSLSLLFVCVIFAFNTRNEWIASINSSVDIPQLKSMLSFGLPLILGGVAFWGLTAVDKVFLRMMVSFDELAIYSVSASFAAAATILQSVFSTVWAPTVYKWASEGGGFNNVQKVSRYILCLVVLCFSLAGLLSWILVRFLPSGYSDVQWIVVSCLGYPLLYTLSESSAVGIGITRRSGFSMLASLISFVVNLVGNWLMIPVYGAAGAAVSTCFAFWVFFVIRTEFSIYLWQPAPRFLLYGYSGVVVLGSGVYSIYGMEFPVLFEVFWCLVLLSWVCVFRNEVKETFLFFKNRVLSMG